MGGAIENPVGLSGGILHFRGEKRKKAGRRSFFCFAGPQVDVHFYFTFNVTVFVAMVFPSAAVTTHRNCQPFKPAIAATLSVGVLAPL